MPQHPLAGKRVTLRPDVLMRELRGESVLLNLDSEQYFGLDEVGTGIWRELTSGKTVDEALAALEEEFDVPQEQLREDVAAFVEKLSNAGLVDVRDA